MTRTDVVAMTKSVVGNIGVLDSKAEGMPGNYVQLVCNAQGALNGVGVMFTFDDHDVLNGIGFTQGISGG